MDAAVDTEGLYRTYSLYYSRVPHWTV